jgi:hypothetical protein
MYIYDIINFSNKISISQIPQFLKEKREEKEELEASIQNFNQKIDNLENIEKEKKQEIQRLSGIAKKLTSHYRLFSIVKYKLDQYGISMENLDQFVDCVKGIANENYDVTNVLAKIGDYDNLLYYIDLYKKEAEAKRNTLSQLNQEINYSKGLVDSYRIKLNVIEKLERMGFGINELRMLYDTLMEIGREKNIDNKSFEQIKKEFFDDLKNYDEILGSRNEKVRLQNEIKHLEMQLIKEKERYNSYPKVIESLEKLSNARIHENDIIKIENIISMAGTSLYKNKSGLNKQNLMDDLQKYGNLKLAIKNLQDKKKKKKINLNPKIKIQPQRQNQKKGKNKEQFIN